MQAWKSKLQVIHYLCNFYLCFVTANLSVQLSSFRLHLYTQSSELGQAVTLISFNKQKGKKRNMVIWYYDTILLIALKYCWRNPLKFHTLFHTNLCVWELCQFRTSDFISLPQGNTWRCKWQLIKCINNKVNSMYQDSDMTFRENLCQVSGLGMPNTWSLEVWEPTI